MTSYVRSKHLQIEHGERGEWTVAHLIQGTRLQVNEAAYKILQLFEQPRSLEELGAPDLVEKATPLIEKLIRNHFIVDSKHPETMADKVLRRTAPSFFNCPHAREFTGRPADIALLGIPFDFGNTAEPGARYGPISLRKISAAGYQYTLDFERKEPKGWYDSNLNRNILQGVTISDAGDISVFAGEGPQTIFGKIKTATREILCRGSFPVIVGGDHSVTYPVISAYESELDIIHFDAHSDFSTYYPGIENHHGNVMSRVCDLKHVGRFYQIGLRGTLPHRESEGSSRIALTVSPRSLRNEGCNPVLDRIPPERDYYLSFDIDVLDPGIAPGTSTPVPGGLTLEEAQDLLQAIGRHRRCVGLDLVEVNPKRDINDITSIVGVELILSFLGAHFEAGGNNA